MTRASARGRGGCARLDPVPSPSRWWRGCATQKQVRVDFSETPRDYLANDYRVSTTAGPGTTTPSTTVDKALEVWATFKSWDFREAYIEKYAAIYSLSDAKPDRAAPGPATRPTSQACEFHVTAQSANWDWNDLEKASSPWRVTLLDALGHELPSERVRIEKLPDAYEREFFPAKTPFTKTYSVRFIMPAPGGRIRRREVGLADAQVRQPDRPHRRWFWKS